MTEIWSFGYRVCRLSCLRRYLCFVPTS